MTQNIPDPQDITARNTTPQNGTVESTQLDPAAQPLQGTGAQQSPQDTPQGQQMRQTANANEQVMRNQQAMDPQTQQYVDPNQQVQGTQQGGTIGQDPNQQTIGQGAGGQGGQGNGGQIKDPEDWATGDQPMTDSQRSYLDSLAKQAGETLPADLTKAQASEHIDRLQQSTGRGQGQQG